MFYIKDSKKDELLNGRTITYIATKSKCSRGYLSYLVNGHPNRNVTKEFIENLIKSIADDSIVVANILKEKGIDETIKYFFYELPDNK